jgi:nitrite reductase/ring-hydroxylating ferredoxin subunit
MSREVSVGRYDELAGAERHVVEIDGLSLGLFFVAGEVRAWRNLCPHLGGPVCQGKLVARTLQGVEPDGRSRGLELSATERVMVCPWHGLEFDLLTGAHPIDAKVRLRGVPVRVANGEVLVTVP